MRLDTAPFTAIAEGRKTVEMRLYDEKRRQILPGDTILFCELGGARCLSATVVALHLFSDFRALYAPLPPTALGYAGGEPCDPADMEAYYSEEEQKAFGVVGIEIAL
jgi:ASC-1-like (ASCH) protein